MANTSYLRFSSSNMRSSFSRFRACVAWSSLPSRSQFFLCSFKIAKKSSLKNRDGSNAPWSMVAFALYLSSVCWFTSTRVLSELGLMVLSRLWFFWFEMVNAFPDSSKVWWNIWGGTLPAVRSSCDYLKAGEELKSLDFNLLPWSWFLYARTADFGWRPFPRELGPRMSLLFMNGPYSPSGIDCYCL